MPTITTQQPLDVTSEASKLPEPLQWWSGALGGAAQGVTGANDPNSMMGVGAPMMAGETKLGPLAQTLFSKVISKIKPAALGYADDSVIGQTLVDFLGSVAKSKVTPPTGGDVLKDLLLNRSTNRAGFPTSYIKAPEGMIFTSRGNPGMEGIPRSAMQMRSPANQRFMDWNRAIKGSVNAAGLKPPVIAAKGVDDLANLAPPILPPQREAPQLSGKGFSGANSKSAQSALKRAGLTEDMVKDIRSMGDVYTAVKKYPNLKENTIIGILKDGSFGWIK